MNFIRILKDIETDGSGCWTKKSKKVRITKIEWQVNEYDDELGFQPETSCCIYFTNKSWDTGKDNFIYTDQGFMNNLKKYLLSLVERGKLPKDLPWEDIGYSEQGMQGHDYVHTVLGDW